MTQWLRYKVFAIGDQSFAGRRHLFGRKVEPPSRPPTRAQVLAKTKMNARNLPGGHGALRKSHGLLAEILPEVSCSQIHSGGRWGK